jgi:hypothetical protein
LPSFHRPVSIVSAVAIAGFALAFLLGGGSNAPAAPALNASRAKPTVSVSFAKPSRSATVRVTFAAMPPPDVTVSASMAMRGVSHVINRVRLQKTSDPHTLQAKLRFSMAGAWTIHIRYDKSREIDVPLKVGT